MPTAFRATFSDVKNIKTRQVVQLVFEVPLADFDAAYEVLGGLPDPSKERWFGIAALKQETEVMPAVAKSTNPAEIRPQPPVSPAGAKRDWRDLQPQQQAGIRCGEPSFIAFLKEQRPDDWRESEDAAECVRLICGVESRAMIGINQKARMIWKQLDDQYQAWKALEHA